MNIFDNTWNSIETFIMVLDFYNTMQYNQNQLLSGP